MSELTCNFLPAGTSHSYAEVRFSQAINQKETDHKESALQDGDVVSVGSPARNLRSVWRQHEAGPVAGSNEAGPDEARRHEERRDEQRQEGEQEERQDEERQHEKGRQHEKRR